MTKRQRIIIGSIAAILLGSFGLMRLLIAQKQDLPVRPPVPGDRWVRAEMAAYGDVLSSVIAKGRVVSTAEVELVAEASGRVESGEVPLKKGQNFQKGQVLLTIYKDEAELALSAQKSQFLNTIANLLPDIRVDFPDQYASFQSFFNSIQLNNELPPLPEYESESIRIFLASRNVLAEYFAVQQAELKLSRHTILAPFKGAFLDVYVEAGAYTNTGGRIGKMIATDALEVEIPVGNESTGWIRPNDPVQLASIDKERVWHGRVTRISDFVDVATQSRSVFARVPLNGQLSLYAGEYLNAEFEGGIVTEVLEIPRNTIFNYDEVFTVIDGQLRIQQVEVVKLNQTTVLIRGIDSGVYVVTQPLINVMENTPVKILGVDQAEDPASLQKPPIETASQ
ncbi:HlyD family efflux transporter periplasmic adaptor subunit [candidate division KSB1 bacterium]|nr:HlyD family efflux transporter periplasmic adaptor subunit [candidate division KSB1 bacterium]